MNTEFDYFVLKHAFLMHLYKVMHLNASQTTTEGDRLLILHSAYQHLQVDRDALVALLDLSEEGHGGNNTSWHSDLEGTGKSITSEVIVTFKAITRQHVLVNLCQWIGMLKFSTGVTLENVKDLMNGAYVDGAIARLGADLESMARALGEEFQTTRLWAWEGLSPDSHQLTPMLNFMRAQFSHQRTLFEYQHLIKPQC